MTSVPVKENDSGVPSVTTAMILAAGLGTRMRPLTEDRPKPLVELAGRSLIDHVLDRLQALGIERAIVNLHYKGDMLERYLRQRLPPPAIGFSWERSEVLDTGGGIRYALPLLGDAPFLLHNSDSVWLERGNDNLRRLIAAFDPENMDCLLLLADKSTSIGYAGKGDFFLQSDGRLRRRRPEEDCPNVFIGASIIHPRLFRDSPEGVFSINLLWDRALAAGRVFGLPFEGRWMHVGDPEALQLAEEVMRQHE